MIVHVTARSTLQCVCIVTGWDVNLCSWTASLASDLNMSIVPVACVLRVLKQDKNAVSARDPHTPPTQYHPSPLAALIDH
jgi:hypothetical protein